MLMRMPKIISPELLKVLCEMGHGDEIVLGDGNFPASSMAKRLVRADGIAMTDLLEAILQIFPLDQYDSSHFILMDLVEGDSVDPIIWNEYTRVLRKYDANATISYMDRFAYYERAKKAYAIVATGEEAQYANIILKKGCVL